MKINVLYRIFNCVFFLSDLVHSFLDDRLLVSSWLEIGRAWSFADKIIEVQGRVETFKNPIVLIGLPEHNLLRQVNNNYAKNIFSFTRILEVKTPTSLNGAVSFKLKQFHSEAVSCNFTWISSRFDYSYQISYMIVEAGHWNISNAEFDASLFSNQASSNVFTRTYYYSTSFPSGIKPTLLTTVQSHINEVFYSYHTVYSSINHIKFDLLFHIFMGDSHHRDNSKLIEKFQSIQFGVFAYIYDYIPLIENLALESYQIKIESSSLFSFPFKRRYSLIAGIFGAISYVEDDSVTGPLPFYTSHVTTCTNNNISINLLQSDDCLEYPSLPLSGSKNNTRVSSAYVSFFVIGILSESGTTSDIPKHIHPKPASSHQNTNLDKSTLLRDSNDTTTRVPSKSENTSFVPLPLLTDTSPMKGINTKEEFENPILNATVESTSDFCLQFSLYDTFGDGWNTCSLIIYDASLHYQILSPSCSQNPVSTSYCFQPELMQDGHQVTATVHGFQPTYPWEVRYY